jgi:hypothetical protein
LEVKARKTKSKQNKGPIGRNINRGCRKADCIPLTAGSEATIQSEVKASERKSKQKGPIKRKNRRKSREADRIP